MGYGLGLIKDRAPRRGVESSPEKAIFQPNLEKKELIHEVDEETKGERAQQTTNVVKTTIIANVYPEDSAQHSTQIVFKNPRMTY